MRVLIAGAAGQVGRAVVETAPRQHSADAKTRAEFDITNEDTIAHCLADGSIDWIVNTAAYTAVDRAENDRDAALAINDTAVGTLTRAASRFGCRLLHLSTDFVFDGSASRAYRPSDATHPLSVYGITKLGGEHQALQSSAAVVLRTSWVYAAAGRNFVLTMLRLMRERNEVRVVADQIGTPTWAHGIARAIWGIIDAGIPGGVYHWSDLGVASWYDFAVAIQEESLERGLLGHAIPVVPIATREYPTPARRPAFSVLDSEATRALVRVPASHWRHNLRLMLDELRAA